MNVIELKRTINEGGFNTAFKTLYGDISKAKARALMLADSFEARFGGSEDVSLFSAPGRTELIGNHTDHNGGLAVGAAIDLDILAVASPLEGGVEIYEGDGLIKGSFSDNTEKGTSLALALGMARRMGGGFKAVIDSGIPQGKGASSSAAFTLLCGKIADSFYGDGKASPMELSLAAKLTENEDYGKNCGLLDQISCAFGGTVRIDFRTPIPTVSSVPYNVGDYGMFLVDTGASHANCGRYASVAEDMEKAAEYFGKSRLGDVDAAVFAEKKERLRLKCGDGVYRRALHFFDENKRVDFFCRRAALGQIGVCLYAVNGSGISSRCNLGNVHKEADDATEALKDIAAAVRIHGGGFGGSLQCYVAKGKIKSFTDKMEALFGKGSVLPINIREVGVCRITCEQS